MDWTTFIAGSMLLLLFMILFWPERGIYFRWARRLRLDSREIVEDALRHLHQQQQGDRFTSTESMAGVLGISTKDALTLAVAWKRVGC